MTLDSKIPSGPLAEKWTRHRFDMKLVNPANKRKYTVIVVGSGASGAHFALTALRKGRRVLMLDVGHTGLGEVNPGDTLEINISFDVTDNGGTFSYGIGNTPHVVPEPASISLLGLGGALLIRRKRRA